MKPLVTEFSNPIDYKSNCTKSILSKLIPFETVKMLQISDVQDRKSLKRMLCEVVERRDKFKAKWGPKYEQKLRFNMVQQV